MQLKIKVIFFLALVVVSATRIGTRIYVDGELKSVEANRITLRDLTEKEGWKLFLYEESLKKGFTYQDFRLLRSIIQAESSWRQFEKSGDVLQGKINPKDIGLCQINSYYHLADAVKDNINIYTPEGNITMCIQIYEEDGWKPWVWSKHMWNRSVI